MLYEFCTLDLPFKAKTEGEQLYNIFQTLGSPNENEISWYKLKAPGTFRYWDTFKNFKGNHLMWKKLRKIDRYNQIEPILRDIFQYRPARRPTAEQILEYDFFK